ncbi:MAG: hypothetical protein K6B41_10385 [Butyrivibrio sp.]|nr:hypothetical protein [Butyrivibrio sp.]
MDYKEVFTDTVSTAKDKVSELYEYYNSLEEQKKKRLWIIALITVGVIAVACIFYNMGKKAGVNSILDDDWDD